MPAPRFLRASHGATVASLADPQNRRCPRHVTPQRCDAPIAPPREREGKSLGRKVRRRPGCPASERSRLALSAPEGLFAGTEAGGQGRSREAGARNAPALTARLRSGSPYKPVQGVVCSVELLTWPKTQLLALQHNVCGVLDNAYDPTAAHLAAFILPSLGRWSRPRRSDLNLA